MYRGNHDITIREFHTYLFSIDSIAELYFIRRVLVWLPIELDVVVTDAKQGQVAVLWTKRIETSAKHADSRNA